MIAMNDFKAEPAELQHAMLDAAKRVIESGWYVLGKECTRFEHDWASICGTTRAVGVGNGMDAIEIALRTLDIGAGDEVITTPMTAFATVLAILRVGASPVFADIDSDTALLSIESVRRCISDRTRALVLVHLYGQIRHMEEWVSLCKERGIELVEDCAQSHLASISGRVAGSFGRVGAYSFYPTKNLGALGDGGMLITSDETLADRAERLRNYGQSHRYHHPEVGLNSRLDEVQAAILGVRLKWLSGFTQRRREIADRYREGIKNSMVRQLAAPVEPDAHVYHLYVVTCEARDALVSRLGNRGVQSLIHYPVPMHMQPPCLNLHRDPQGLVQSERHARACLSLPCHPQLSDEQVNTVLDAVNSLAG